MHNKRGQAAMEFLMTYGWAILAAITAIGVLAYFGVFSLGKYSITAAVITPPFYADAWNAIDSSDQVNLEIKNNGAEPYEIQSISLENINGASSCTPATPGSGLPAIPDNTLSPNTKIQATINCTDMSADNTFKADITITYRKQGSTLDQVSTGTISDKIVP